MMPHIRVFAGPSLYGYTHQTGNFDFAPPAKRGDIITAVRDGVTHILLIDGYFESRIAVWHKEILWAMAQGVTMAGAASMGALRAAELHPFGMMGIGKIFEDYRDGILTGDDEVAVSHGPAELGYLPTNVALVNVRATLAAALKAGHCDTAIAKSLLAAAKSIFFKNLSWENIVAGATLTNPQKQDVLQWLQDTIIDQKYLDAQQGLDYISTATIKNATPSGIKVPMTCYLNVLLNEPQK